MSQETKRSRPSTGWSVRAHLGAIVLAVIVVFVGLGAYLGLQAMESAERTVETNAAYLAGVGSEAVTGSMALGTGQVTGVAANPGAARVFTDPAACQATFALDLFPGARLDLLDPEGRIVCSTLPEVTRVSERHTGAWLADLDEDDLVETGPVIDPVTGERAVIVAAPLAAVDDEGARVGSVAMVVPTAGIADQLAALFAGPRGFRFSIVDETTGTTLSLSGGIPDGANELPSPDVLAEAEPVVGTTWVVHTGLDAETALGPTRSVLLRGLLVGGVVLLVLLTSFAVLNRRIARPLRRLTGAVSDAGPHVDVVLASVTGPAEVTALARAFQRALRDHQTFEQQLSHQALHDPLTGLPNRALLAERLSHSLEQARRSGGTVAVIFFDLDRFKLVNDSLGHGVGDQVLTAVATSVADVLRPGDTLSRFGGDEFVVVGEAFGSPAEAEHLAERVIDAVAAPIEATDTIVRVTASAGIALGDPGSRPGDLIRDADTAMYLAKERGGGRHAMFDQCLREEVTDRMTLETELRVALERQELTVAYQPQVDLGTGEVVGVEALARWQHPALGSVPPSRFIPVAEETGLILPIGQFVLREACTEAAGWAARGMDLAVAVNLSGRQLADPRLIDEVRATLAETGLAPDRLCLELTESVLMYDSERAERAMAALHALGVQLSVDDFGTGYSSLAYLHRFPVDELKIDRVFVNGLTHGADQGTLVTAVVAMAHALGLRIVAEGVETADQAAQLRRLGCQRAQGYHFARPGSADAAIQTVRPTVTTVPAETAAPAPI